MGKLISKIIKVFDLPLNMCPNLKKKRGKGVLQFLIHKRFSNKTIDDESWKEMVVEAVGSDESLQAELVDKVTVFGTLKEALYWAKKFNLEKNYWNYKLIDYDSKG